MTNATALTWTNPTDTRALYDDGEVSITVDLRPHTALDERRHGLVVVAQLAPNRVDALDERATKHRREQIHSEFLYSVLVVGHEYDPRQGGVLTIDAAGESAAAILDLARKAIGRA